LARRKNPNDRKENSGGLLALLPLVMVFTALALLAVGANRIEPGHSGTSKSAASQARIANSPTEQAGKSRRDASKAAAAEDAAAAAVVAISLARVAPPLPEEALDPPKLEAQSGRRDPQRQQDASQRPGARTGASEPPGAPLQIGKADAGLAPAGGKVPAEATTDDESLLSRIGSYAPSPRRIANAVSDSVTKLASFIPGL